MRVQLRARRQPGAATGAAESVPHGTGPTAATGATARTRCWETDECTNENANGAAADFLCVPRRRGTKSAWHKIGVAQKSAWHKIGVAQNLCHADPYVCIIIGSRRGTKNKTEVAMLGARDTATGKWQGAAPPTRVQRGDRTCATAAMRRAGPMGSRRSVTPSVCVAPETMATNRRFAP